MENTIWWRSVELINLQGSHGDWKMKMVMEKSWNMKTWLKVMVSHGILLNLYLFCRHKEIKQ